MESLVPRVGTMRTAMVNVGNVLVDNARFATRLPMLAVWENSRFAPLAIWAWNAFNVGATLIAMKPIQASV